MKQSYLITVALCIVVSLATFYFTKNAQPVKSSQDAMEILAANGHVEVVADTLTYTQYGETNGGYSRYEVNALAYLSEDFDAIHLVSQEGLVDKELYYEAETLSDSVRVFKLRTEGVVQGY
jgi:hypothetical protein